ncbi:YggS family pyridoxal phosphate-dependent enzyme [Haemophilus parahaemolyticus]|uniref:Pyridoxal phosphate homeostasis protein n=2 Tax=Haemophilus parahaemolyticus TaxID=735 RepID=A0AAE6JV04_HAEPH|nr:YggS family pyridoxal phosphate-dependent enzyme [Haemophilus parahaemolyticus]EIJ73311.1 pyridoxal phosphate enzyme, YggS family [Haemophilus parahaemolyticus HK385]OOR95798.1 YggS family pyridoxal phosphate enzyme [Haemophilus parahaemolyticus]QEN11291.1 YggS family pyridoxal phosphate-dependent enzyme [Haemophilus parahaemolyticus]QRP12486.1 YggS family pyridoxal phosphate-dependent enzyme [Haemophilus parahaemolyticus]STO66722.1 succinyl-diaminopimelate desuccinylase [Haemophilus paraha
MSISENLSRIQQQIEQISAEYQRENVRLLAVSKTKPVQAIEEAIRAGQCAFGENYVQEGVEKIAYFSGNKLLEWHFIGPLQSNKSRLVAEHFDWIQTVDRFKIAERLNDQRPEHLPPLNVLIQINISDESSKSGIQPEEMFSLAEKISQFPRLKLRGLMAIPKPESEPEQQKIALRKMKDLFNRLQQRFESVDTLSMGMSDDMASAIDCGSTMVRIGTAIFGERNYSQKV